MIKTKKQLRAEAVERLKNCAAARFDAESIVIALASGRHGQSDWSLECYKLIDLLTDDELPEGDAVSVMRKVANSGEVTGKAMRVEVGGTDWADALLILADMIERDYVSLPVDTDGDVVHIGDELKCQGESVLLNSLVWDGREWYATETVVSSGWYPMHLCRYVKPRTLEDVLRDVWREALDYAKSDMWRSPDEVFAERADEIRELMEAGE